MSSASGSRDHSWRNGSLCDQFGSLRVSEGRCISAGPPIAKPSDLNAFGPAGVYTPPPSAPPQTTSSSLPSYAQLHSQRSDTHFQQQHQQHQLKHGQARVASLDHRRSFSDVSARQHHTHGGKESLPHRRRMSESSDYSCFLGGTSYSDDDREENSPRGSVTALDFLRQSNTLQRTHSCSSSKARDTFHGSRGSFSRRNSFYANHTRSNSMTSLSTLLESPTRSRGQQQRHHTNTEASARYQRDRVSMQPEHLRALQQQGVNMRHASNNAGHSSQMQQGHGVHGQGRALAHAQTQVHFLATRRSSASMGQPDAYSGLRQLTSPPPPTKGFSPHAHSNSSSQSGVRAHQGTETKQQSSITSPNQLGPEGYNSFRVIASPHALRGGSSPAVGGSSGRDRSGPVHINDELYKTELCSNWITTGACSYGSKCNFSHGYEDLRPRKRVENYKSQPCCDPARMGCRRCMYDKRCNYAHPGEALRRPRPAPYFDKNYFAELKKDFPKTQYPFGIYL